MILQGVRWVVLLALLAGAFIAGRASVTPDDQGLRDELSLWKRDFRTAAGQRDASRHAADSLTGLVGSLNEEAARWRGRALASEQQGDRFKRRADSLLALLPHMLTARDSNAILVNACTERGNECAAIRTANAELKEAAAKDSTVKARQSEAIAVHLGQRRRDSTELSTEKTLIGKLERAVRGCRLPLIGFPCPSPVVEYTLDDQSFRAGGSFPLKLGPLGLVNFTVTTRIAGRRP